MHFFSGYALDAFFEDFVLHNCLTQKFYSDMANKFIDFK